MSRRLDIDEMVLTPILVGQAREEVRPCALDAERPVIVGRSSAADWTIPDQAVSRRHASVERDGDAWVVADLNSRHGTYVNGQRLEPGERIPIRHADVIRFGHWPCRCETPGVSSRHSTTTRLLDSDERSHVSPIGAEALGGVAQMRLDTLISASQELESRADRAEIADVLIRAAQRGASCRRVLVVRPIGEDDFEVLASTDPGEEPRLSRSLLAGAFEQERMVQLSAPSHAAEEGHSIADLNIRTAICAPILVGDAIDAFLYLDTRGGEHDLSPDAAAFCRALAQLGGLAFDRLLRQQIDERRRQLERDLSVARRAQELLMPSRAEEGGRVRYAFRSVAGRLVAGDLFDVIPLDEDRVAFFLGDVSGKGVGAAVLMSAAQATLRSLLSRSVGLSESLETLNEHLVQRTSRDAFITLLAGVVDRRDGSVDLVDAGHALCCLRRKDEPPSRPEISGGLPLAVSAGERYRSSKLPLDEGDRLVVFSDGVVEQRSPGGKELGVEAAHGALEASTSCEEDVRRLFDLVEAHAEGQLADDLTVLSLEAR